ncbi:hypothetical protein FO519_007630 [Halicephalobus sp. NKZ332]|nr:hypothetical protein FO519_007630 [Halicephalobus sp. NKZ332]
MEGKEGSIIGGKRHPCVEVKFGKIFTEAYIAPVGSITFCKKSIALKAGYSIQIQKAVGKLGSLKSINFVGKAAVEIGVSGRRIASEIYVAEDNEDCLPLVLAGDVLKQFQAIKIQEGEKQIHFGNTIVPFIYKDGKKGNVFSVTNEVLDGEQ